MKEDFKSLGIIAIAIAVVTIPFLNMAYHVDADWFIDVADQIIKDPLRAYSGHGEIAGFSGVMNDFEGNSTPLASYYLAFVLAFLGRSSVIVHTSYIIFTLIAGFSFYYLAKKYTSRPLLSTIVMCTSLVFVLMSHNIMLDIPMLGFLLLSIVLFVYGVDRDSHILMALGCVFAALSYLAKPNGIFSWPVLVLYTLIKRKYRYSGYILLTLGIIGLWSFETYVFEGRAWIIHHLPHLFGLKKSMDFGVMAAYFFSNLSYIGGATIFPFFYVYPFLLKRINLILTIASFAFMAVVSVLLYHVSASFVSGQYKISELLMFLMFSGCFLAFMLIVVFEYYHAAVAWFRLWLKRRSTSKDDNFYFIVLCFFASFIFNTLISGGSAKYVTLMLPFTVLLFSVILERYSKIHKMRYEMLLLAVIICSVPVSIMVSYADYDFASVYREFALKNSNEYKTDGNTVWYSGFYGLRYYMNQQGHRILGINSSGPKKGDYIIYATIPSPRHFTNELQNRVELKEVIAFEGNLPIRTQNQYSHAGFYTYGGGFLPYSISNAPMEKLYVYYVKE